MRILTIILIVFSALSLHAQEKNEHYKKASDYYDKKEYANALKQLDIALEADPANVESLLLKANAQEQLQQYKPAFETYSELIRLHPDDALALSQRGLLLNSLQEFEYAMTDFNKALGLNNADSVKIILYLNRGAVKINIRDFHGAYDDFMAAYTIDSQNIGVLNNLATVCDEVGKGNETLGYLYKIIKIDTNFVGAYGNIGFKYQQMGDYKTAIKFFNKVLEIDPNEPLAFGNRGFNKYKLGDLDGALADVNKSLTLLPSNSYTYRTRAMIYIAQKKKKNACDDLQKALDMGFTTMYGDEVQLLQLRNCQ